MRARVCTYVSAVSVDVRGKRWILGFSVTGGSEHLISVLGTELTSRVRAGLLLTPSPSL